MLTIALTPQQFAAAKAKIEQELGSSLAVPNGTIDHEGVKLAYSYDGQSTLTVNVLHKPFILSQNVIEGKIREWFSA